MFMADDKKKKMAAVIIARKKENGEEERSERPKDEEGSDADFDYGIDTAVEELVEALDRKDRAAIKETMRSLINMVIDEQDSISDESDED